MHDRIGPYEIEREVGRGGMGVVYLARDTRLDRRVAIKSLPPELAADPARLERFEREAKTLAALSHVNIAGIYGVEVQDGARYLVLEYVEGETLADRLDRGPMPVDEAMEVAVQIAAGVEAAHEAGVIHRDLKPANIQMTAEGVVKVLDFGLARIDEGATSSSGGGSNSPTMTTPRPQHSPTILGAILGTAAYMSPEQARGRRVDKRTDIWSFGVLLYEMLVGASPFRGETVTDSIGAVLHKDIDLSRLPPGTPAGVRHVLNRCMERDKSMRYRDIGDVRIELAQAGAEHADAPARRAPVGGLIAAGVLCAALAGSAAWMLKPAGELARERVLSVAIPIPDGLEIVGSIDISRDGRFVAFAAWNELGEQYVYLRRLDSFDLMKVQGSREGHNPFFSPDGESLGFFARNSILRVSTSGGAPTWLCDTTVLVGASWMDDDTILYSSGFDSPIRRMTSGGVQLEPVSKLEQTGAYAHVWPQNIPGTDRVLFTAWGAVGGGQGGSHVVDMKTGEIRPLTVSTAGGAPGRWSASGHLIFEKWSDGLFSVPFDPLIGTPISPGDARLLLEDVHHLGNGTRSVFAISETGTLVYVPAARSDRRLVRVAKTGETETILAQSEVSGYTSIDGAIEVSADGKRLLIGGAGDVQLLDLDRGTARRLTFDEHNDIFPVWSADESRVYFQSNREDRWKIWSVPVDGSAPASVLIENEFSVSGASVGPDDEVVFTITHPETGKDIWIRSPDGTMRSILSTPHQELLPDVSPDGKTIAYQSDVSGIFEVYLISVSGSGAPAQVSKGGGTSPKWSPDGKWLMYRRGRAILRVGIEAGRPVGEAEQIFKAENLAGGNRYELAPDGESMFAIQLEDDAIPNQLRVVTNFFEVIRGVSGRGTRQGASR